LAGIHALSVVRRATLGNPPTAHEIVASNSVAFSVSPIITASVNGSLAEVTFSPPLGAAQKVALLLNQTGVPNAPSYRLKAPPFAAGATQVAFSLAGAAAGTYRVRALVDGAESPESSPVLVGP